MKFCLLWRYYSRLQSVSEKLDHSTDQLSPKYSWTIYQHTSYIRAGCSWYGMADFIFLNKNYKVAGWCQYYDKIYEFSLNYIFWLKAEAAQYKYTITVQDTSLILTIRNQNYILFQKYDTKVHKLLMIVQRITNVS